LLVDGLVLKLALPLVLRDAELDEDTLPDEEIEGVIEYDWDEEREPLAEDERLRLPDDEWELDTETLGTEEDDALVLKLPLALELCDAEFDADAEREREPLRDELCDADKLALADDDREALSDAERLALPEPLPLALRDAEVEVDKLFD
jgi:hypothetical protein